ncbi:MAG: efflux RND transporter periplasmic adaptor subunit [Burkholderiales bacterium]
MAKRRRHAIRLALLPLLLTFIVGCGEKGTAQAEAKKSAPTVPVLTGQVIEKPVPMRLHAIGTVEPMASVAVKARVDGLIVKVHVRDGQEVAKGDLLFQLDPKPYESQLAHAEADLARDQAQLDYALGQETRYKELLANNFVSPEGYAQVAANFRALESTVAGSVSAVNRARINIGYTSIRATLDGRAGKVLLGEGNLIRANDDQPMVVINQIAPIYVSLAVPENRLNEVRASHKKAPVRVEVAPDKSARLSGLLAFVDNAVDVATGTIKLRGQFANRDRLLWPGQFVDAWVVLGDEEKALVVPTQALQTGPKGQFVYVVSADGSAELREVTVARAEGNESVIAGGLKVGETVVVDGASRVQPGSKLGIKTPDKPS